MEFGVNQFHRELGLYGEVFKWGLQRGVGHGEDNGRFLF